MTFKTRKKNKQISSKHTMCYFCPNRYLIKMGKLNYPMVIFSHEEIQLYNYFET